MGRSSQILGFSALRAAWLRLGPGIALIALMLAAVAQAETAPATARSTDALSAIPRMPDGKPDFSGVWQVINTANWDIEPHHARPGVPPGLGIVIDGPLPYKKEALAKRRQNYEKRSTGDVDVKCWLPGVPRIMYEPYPFMIAQTPSQINMIFEYVGARRFIYLNRPHPEGPLEWWMGDSRGKWEGDTLVVDVLYFNADPWLDRSGNYHSEDLHVVERYTYLTPNHIRYQARLEDPQVFVRPFNIEMVLYRHTEPYSMVLDDYCFGFADRDIRPSPPRAVRDAGGR